MRFEYDDGDMFAEMRTALLMERALQNQAEMSQNRQVADLELKSRDVLEFATIEGARACGLEDRVGSITPGKQADLVMLRRDTLNLTPLNDPGGSVVQAAGPGNVDTVMVAGRIVKQGENCCRAILIRCSDWRPGPATMYSMKPLSPSACSRLGSNKLKGNSCCRESKPRAVQ